MKYLIPGLGNSARTAAFEVALRDNAIASFAMLLHDFLLNYTNLTTLAAGIVFKVRMLFEVARICGVNHLDQAQPRFSSSVLKVGIEFEKRKTATNLA